MAYEKIEPFGSLHDELRSAIIAVGIANANRPANSPPADIFDYMPSVDRPEQSPESIEASLNDWKAFI